MHEVLARVQDPARRLPDVALSIGMLLPSGNVVAERQLRAMLAPGVALHTTRLPLTGSSEGDLAAMTERLDDAARLLADARVHLIAFNCTAVSTFAPGAETAIVARIREAAATPAVTTAEALIAALQAQRASRVVLVTPYIEPVTAREAVFLQHHGIEVVHHASRGIDRNWDMAQVSDRAWYDFTVAQRHDAADAYVLSCTAIESASVIDALESTLGRPVVTSNQALAWHCQRSAGVDTPVEGFGRLLRTPGVMQRPVRGVTNARA